MVWPSLGRWPCAKWIRDSWGTRGHLASSSSRISLKGKASTPQEAKLGYGEGRDSMRDSTSSRCSIKGTSLVCWAGGEKANACKLYSSLYLQYKPDAPYLRQKDKKLRPRLSRAPLISRVPCKVAVRLWKLQGTARARQGITCAKGKWPV